MAGPARYLGVDFSGAASAGRTIWIAAAERDGAGLTVTSLLRAADLPGGGRSRESALPALTAYVAGSEAAAAGFDFPFALPAALMPESGWDDFVREFPARYANADDFRRQCREAAGGLEWKREADRLARTPFAAYNLRLYRQTYYGIGQVLRPLIASNSAAVAPMQTPLPDKPALIEVCPASTLKTADLYLPYKGRSAIHRTHRQRIAAWLGREGGMRFASQQLEDIAIGNPGGDALDALLAVSAAARAACRMQDVPPAYRAAAAVEGWVFL